MDKKIFISIFLVIILIANISFAADTPSAQLNITSNKQTVQTTDTTVEITMTLGNLQGLEETAGNIVLGYQAKLSYDSAMFKSVKVEGLNGWTATYENGTIVADTTSAKPNTDITKITLTLNENLEAGISGKIDISNVLLSDGENDFTFNKEITITTEAKQTEDNGTGKEEETKPSTSDENVTTTEKNDNKNNSNVQNRADGKTTLSKLPKAGLANTMISLAAIILVIGAVSLIRYKMIKLK